MKVFATDADGRPALRDAPVPAIGPGEALVRTVACGICTSDTLGWYLKGKSPIVLGHEPAGIVEATGPGVSHLAPGDRVFVHHHAPCLSCRYCQRGRYVLCATWKATRLDPGGLAELFRVPEINLSRDTLKIPDGLPMEAGCLVEPLGTVVKAFDRGRFAEGMTVLVIGLGVMGQMAVAYARASGAARVFAADLVRERLAVAEGFGADKTIDANRGPIASQLAPGNGGLGADLVFVGPGTIRAMEDGIAAAAPGAAVVFFTMAPPGEKLAIEPNALYFREIDLVSSYSCGPEDTRRALDLIAGGRIPWARLITHRYPFERAGEAFARVQAGGEALKVLVDFPGAASARP